LSFQIAKAQRVVDLATGYVDRRINSAARAARTGASAGFTVAHQDVSNLVPSYRTHPAPVSIRSVGSLLEYREGRRFHDLDRRGDLHPARAVVGTGGAHVKVDKPVLRGNWLGRICEHVHAR